jgi:hypothetical protein
MIDLTWPQYERSTSPTGTRSSLRREPLTTVKKDRLLPLKYEGNTEIELDWDNVEVNSIIRAVVSPRKLSLLRSHQVGRHRSVQGHQEQSLCRVDYECLFNLGLA